jgi:ABC-type transport system involved in multi-copper enzyme maturation permease subunit
VATLLSLLAVYVVFGNNPWGPSVCAWVNALQVSIGLILVCVTTGTALAEERAQGSLDLLLATPLTTRAIVWGKWLGAYCTVPLLAVLPALVATALLWRSSRLAAWLGLLALVLGQGVAITSLGLAVTTWIARLGRALAVSVTLLVLLTVLPFLGLLTTHNRETEWIALLSPFYGPGEQAR